MALDQATKQIALDKLAAAPFEIVEGAVTLRLTFNSGGAFGVGQGLPMLFLVASVAIAALIVVWARRVRDRGVVLALGLILGGGLGNLWDRLFRDLGGRVVDFVDLHIWPVFNLADACIVIGVAALFWSGMRARERPAP